MTKFRSATEITEKKMAYKWRSFEKVYFPVNSVSSVAIGL
jgi:hypothetical protein